MCAVMCPVCTSESLIKKLTFSPQDTAESPNVVPVHSSRTGDGGGILVKPVSSQSVSRICVSTPMLPVVLALPRLSRGALGEDVEDACEVC